MYIYFILSTSVRYSSHKEQTFYSDVELICSRFACRKHTLNCHRMKPALFSVLCEIKEKTGE